MKVVASRSFIVIIVLITSFLKNFFVFFAGQIFFSLINENALLLKVPG